MAVGGDVPRVGHGARQGIPMTCGFGFTIRLPVRKLGTRVGAPWCGLPVWQDPEGVGRLGRKIGTLQQG